MDSFVVRTKHVAAVYDTRATETTSCHDRLRGNAAALKIRHNTVKRALIEWVGRQCPGGRLLDIGCGRGGDLRKWIAAALSYAKGLDISHLELHEARRRYREMGKVVTACEFQWCDRLGIDVWDDPEAPYDCISSMFSLHYFWGSSETAHALMAFVSRNLRPGGYFVGIVPDGRRINMLLTSSPSSKIVATNPRLEVTAHWDGKPSAFGSAYFWEIEDTVTSMGSLEFLVYESVVTAVAAKHGLAPVACHIPGVSSPGNSSTGTSKAFYHLVADDDHPATTTAAAFILQKTP